MSTCTFGSHSAVSNGHPLKLIWEEDNCIPSQLNLCVHGYVSGERAARNALKKAFSDIAARKTFKVIVVCGDAEATTEGMEAWIAAVSVHLSDRQFVYASGGLSIMLYFDERYTTSHPTHVFLSPYSTCFSGNHGQSRPGSTPW